MLLLKVHFIFAWMTLEVMMAVVSKDSNKIIRPGEHDEAVQLALSLAATQSPLNVSGNISNAFLMESGKDPKLSLESAGEYKSETSENVPKQTNKIIKPIIEAIHKSILSVNISEGNEPEETHESSTVTAADKITSATPTTTAAAAAKGSEEVKTNTASSTEKSMSTEIASITSTTISSKVPASATKAATNPSDVSQTPTVATSESTSVSSPTSVMMSSSTSQTPELATQASSSSTAAPALSSTDGSFTTIASSTTVAASVVASGDLNESLADIKIAQETNMKSDIEKHELKP